MTDLALTAVMPCYLGPYEGAASNGLMKLHRAICSYLTSLGDFDRELILVSDGCDQTDEYFAKLSRNFGGTGEPNATVRVGDRAEIRHIRLPKQPGFGSCSRNAALDVARGEWIAYLDADDMVTPEHFANIVAKAGDRDWVWFDSIFWPNLKRETKLEFGSMSTACFAHKASMSVRWADDYCADWKLVESLMAASENHAHIDGGGYIICHIPNKLDA